MLSGLYGAMGYFNSGTKSLTSFFCIPSHTYAGSIRKICHCLLTFTEPPNFENATCLTFSGCAVCQRLPSGAQWANGFGVSVQSRANCSRSHEKRLWQPYRFTSTPTSASSQNPMWCWWLLPGLIYSTPNIAIKKSSIDIASRTANGVNSIKPSMVHTSIGSLNAA
mgnify:CR=1 FL=1